MKNLASQLSEIHGAIEQQDIQVASKDVRDVSVQVNVKKATYRSKTTSAKVATTTIALSPFKKKMVDTSTSPFKKETIPKSKTRLIGAEKLLSSSSSNIASERSLEEYQVSDTSSSADYKEELLKKECLELRKKSTLLVIEMDSKLYLGLPRESYFIIKLLSSKIPTHNSNILLTLKKIRLDDTFAVLSHDFNMSVSNVGRVFRKTVQMLTAFLKKLIFVRES